MTDRRSLDGRTALVTGSIDGLGNVMAAALAEAGAHVMLSDIRAADECAGAIDALRCRHGARIAYHEADLSDPARVTGLIDDTATHFGPVTILVNNAVVRHFAPLEKFPLDHWNRALSVNLTAAFLAIQQVLPAMRRLGYGRIINMTSIYGMRGAVDRVGYVTTKSALQGLTRAAALEVAGSPVSCHALMPGSVRTPGTQVRVDALVDSEGVTAKDAEARFLEGKQPSGRFIDPQSVADMLLLLCGPAGEDMNGAVLPVEGGWLARS